MENKMTKFVLYQYPEIPEEVYNVAEEAEDGFKIYANGMSAGASMFGGNLELGRVENGQVYDDDNNLIEFSQKHLDWILQREGETFHE